MIRTKGSIYRSKNQDINLGGCIMISWVPGELSDSIDFYSDFDNIRSESHYFRYFTITTECTWASELSIDMAPANIANCAANSADGVCWAVEEVAYSNFGSYKVPDDCKVNLFILTRYSVVAPQV